MANKDYLEKLKDPRWQKKRLEILQRDNWQCRICGQKHNQLHVHHLFYENTNKDPWEYDNSILITLCDTHHETIHKQKMFEYLSMIVFNVLLIQMNVTYDEFLQAFGCESEENKINNIKQFIIQKLNP